MSKFYNILSFIGNIIIYIILTQISNVISKDISHSLVENSNWGLVLYIIINLTILFFLAIFLFNIYDKNIRYELGVGKVDLLINLRKQPLSPKVEITIRGNINQSLFNNPTINLSSFELRTRKVFINSFVFVYKMKKLPIFIGKKDFVKLLIIANEDELLKKYFPIELRKEKIKNIL
jgi:hypothetical protein